MTLLAAVMLLLAAVGGNSGGSILYATHCASCHGDNGQGSSVAPSLIEKPAVDIHLMLDTGRMPAADPYANEIHRAPAFTQPQMQQLVDYVLSFSLHPDASMPLLGPGDPRRGRALFAENCAVCHGAGGSGASVGFSNVAPSLMHATSFQVAEAIRAGPEVMPRFGPDVLSDRDVDDIVRYVNLLQTQADGYDGEDAGGIALGHVGPVAEGFIAWLFGIGALVLLCRKIGSTD
ncbi:MAG TPA: c-type cytochrome [Candidatus Tumulicola sp.]|nr:c-type cytochrome [Candidatus Tumulicola sp.]